MMPQSKNNSRCRWSVMCRMGLFLTAVFCVAGATNGFADEDQRIPDEVVVLYNLAYREGPSASWKLDLAMPKEPASTPRPAIVAIHGGGWIEGGRSSFSHAPGGRPGHIIDFAKLGFVAMFSMALLATVIWPVVLLIWKVLPLLPPVMA